MTKLILFDLDGTLTNPFEGITRCVQYALESFGISEPDQKNLTPFIGPPLIDSFMNFYGFTKEQGEEAVEKYRERFRTIGMFENELYDGVPRMLQIFREHGCVLAVASSKPEVFVNQILEHFHIREYFSVIVGSELDGRRTAKEEVIAEVFRRLQHKPEEYNAAIMVGDRKYDMEGAKKWGMTAIGVSYGFAAPGELETAGADCIADTVEALTEIITDTLLFPPQYM